MVNEERKMNWKGRKVFITGAGGFIGSHLVEKLVRMGAKVKAFIRYNSRSNFGNLELLEDGIRNKIEIVFGDLRDASSVDRELKGCEIVFHLGALIAIPYSYINPSDYIQTNVFGTTNVLNACLKHRIKKMIHTSTSEVYGSAQYLPIDENHPLCGQSPYSASKIGADKIVESYYRSFNLPVITIRPFNTYGPRQSARAIIPTIISQALSKNSAINLGTFFTSRDFNYIDDIVQAFVMVADSTNCLGEVINIGSGIEVTIKQLITEISNILGKRLKIRQDVARLRPKKSEVERLVADSGKAKKLLGWKPKVKLNNGLIKTIMWIKRYLNHYKPQIYNI
jgi:NAD dependent epimerase/dehydratase